MGRVGLASGSPPNMLRFGVFGKGLRSLPGAASPSSSSKDVLIKDKPVCVSKIC